MNKSSDGFGFRRLTARGEWDGVRLDRFIRAHYPGMSFAAAQMHMRKGAILVNGKRVTCDARLRDGDTVEVRFEEREREIPASDSPAVATWGVIGREVPILFEDACLLVLNKPAGIVVQPGNRKEKGSLLDLLVEYRMRSEPTPGADPAFPYTPVHRLDRETTGVLVVAKTRPAARALSRSLAGRAVEKVYLAVVHGTPSPQRGTVSKPLSISKGTRSRAAAAAKGTEAHTHYALKKTVAGGMSLLEVRIETGRTHQIRAHLAAIGHPVAGDGTYGHAGGGRLLLHAWRIRFPHPVSGEPVEVTAPPPDDIDDINV